MQQQQQQQPPIAQMAQQKLQAKQQPRVQPGFQFVNRAQGGGTMTRRGQVKFLPQHAGSQERFQQVARRHDVEARMQAMMHPNPSMFQWYQPAYVNFMGGTRVRGAYPQDFAYVYGSGPQPDHYYVGLTPKDVLLSMAGTGKESMSRLARPAGAPTVVREQEIQRSAAFMQQFSEVFYQGKVPSNAFVQELMQRTMYSVNNLLQSGKPIGTDTRNVLQAFVQLMQSLNQVLMEKNADQVVQSFVHHAMLSSIVIKQLRDRLRQSQGAFVDQGRQHGADMQVNVIGLLMQSGQIYEAVGDLLRLFQQVVSPNDQSMFPQAQGGYTTTYTYVPQTGAYQTMAGVGLPTMQAGIMTDGDLVEEMGFETPVYHATRAQSGPQQPQPQFQRPQFYEETPVMQPRLTKLQPTQQSVPVQQVPTQPTTTGYVPLQQQPIASPQQQEPPFQATPGQVNYISMLQQSLDSEVAVRILEDVRVMLQSLSQDESARQLVEMVGQMLAELGQISGVTAGDQRGIPLLYHDANRWAMLTDLKKIVERFAGGYPLDDLISLIDELQELVANSWPLRSYLADLQYFLLRGMSDPQYLYGTDFLPKGLDLLKMGRELFSSGEFAELTNEALNEFFALVDGLKQDATTHQLVQSVQQLVAATFIDQNGEYTFKTDLLKDMRDTFVPLVIQSLRYIPLPRVEVYDPAIDFALDNIVLNIENILPNLVEFSMTNSVQASPRQDLPDAYFSNVAELNVIQIQADLTNVEFAFNKKSFPQFQDVGLADIFLGGNGLSIYTKTAVDTNLWYTTLIPVAIKCDIDALKIKLHDSSHDAIYRLLGKNLIKLLKQKISRSVEEAIFMFISRMDAMVTKVANRQQPKIVDQRVHVW